MVKLVLVASALAAAVLQTPLKVASVVVTETGRLEPQDVGIDLPNRCRAYRPTGRQVLRWFSAARRVAMPIWVEADRSQCWARGVLRTQDGRTYRWALDQAGLGTVTLSSSLGYYYKGKALPFKIGL